VFHYLNINDKYNGFEVYENNLKKNFYKIDIAEICVDN